MSWFLLLLPVVTALVWAVLVGLLSARRPASPDRFLTSYGGHVQLAILVGVLGCALLADGGLVAEPTAVREARTTGMGVALVALAAVVSGPLLYVGELVLAAAVGSRLRPGRLRRVVDGPTPDVAAVVARRPVLWLPLVAALPAVEELLWRRILVPHLVGDWGWSVGAAVAVSAVSFGAGHYWFGARNVATKTVLGVLWGTCYVLGGLTCAVLAHVSFEAFVWRGLTRRPRVVAAPDRLVSVT